MSLGAVQIAASTGPEIVRWPLGGARRTELAALHVPCLLVVARAEPIPTLGEHEDFVLEGADERDVAWRLEQLARRFVPPAIGPTATTTTTTIAVLVAAGAPELTASQSGLIHRLLLEPGRLVRWAELADAAGHADAAAVVESLGDRLAASGWQITLVGAAGALIESLDGAA